MRLNKRAGIPFTVLVLVTIVVAIVISLLVAYKLYLEDEGLTDKASDGICSLSSSARTLSKAGQESLFPDLCSTKPKTIAANDWNNCPYYKKQLAEHPEHEEKDYYNDCAAEQFAKLMVKCWGLKGSGEGDSGNFECYTVCVSSDEFVRIARAELARLNVSSEQAIEDVAKKQVAADRDKEEFGIDSTTYNTSKWALTTQHPTPEDLNELEKELGDAQRKLDNLLDSGRPTVSLKIGDIEAVMREATIKNNDRVHYSDLLSSGRIDEMDYWDEVFTKEKFPPLNEAFTTKGLEKGKITDGQVISIWFIDDVKIGNIGPYSVIRLDKDGIKLESKITC